MSWSPVPCPTMRPTSPADLVVAPCALRAASRTRCWRRWRWRARWCSRPRPPSVWRRATEQHRRRWRRLCRRVVRAAAGSVASRRDQRRRGTACCAPAGRRTAHPGLARCAGHGRRPAQAVQAREGAMRAPAHRYGHHGERRRPAAGAAPKNCFDVGGLENGGEPDQPPPCRRPVMRWWRHRMHRRLLASSARTCASCRCTSASHGLSALSAPVPAVPRCVLRSSTRNLAALEAVVPAWLAGVPATVHSEHGWDVSDPGGTRRKFQWLRRAYSPS